MESTVIITDQETAIKINNIINENSGNQKEQGSFPLGINQNNQNNSKQYLNGELSKNSSSLNRIVDQNKSDSIKYENQNENNDKLQIEEINKKSKFTNCEIFRSSYYLFCCNE